MKKPNSKSSNGNNAKGDVAPAAAKVGRKTRSAVKKVADKAKDLTDKVEDKAKDKAKDLTDKVEATGPVTSPTNTGVETPHPVQDAGEKVEGFIKLTDTLTQMTEALKDDSTRGPVEHHLERKEALTSLTTQLSKVAEAKAGSATTPTDNVLEIDFRPVEKTLKALEEDTAPTPTPTLDPEVEAAKKELGGEFTDREIRLAIAARAHHQATVNRAYRKGVAHGVAATVAVAALYTITNRVTKRFMD